MLQRLRQWLRSWRGADAGDTIVEAEMAAPWSVAVPPQKLPVGPKA
jgi:hypothetical protein